jgi:hypothetical protein
MKKLILTLIVFAVATLAVNDAFARPRLFRRNAAPVYARPAPAVVVQPQAGYRAYSYEPGPVATMGTYRTYRAAPRTATGFGDATRKALGNY